MGNPIPDVDHRVHGGGWLDACVGDIRERIAACLSALPLAIEVETPTGVVGMVHADFPYDDWQAIHDATFSPEDEEACLWSVDRYQMQYSQPVRNVRAVVHGHMTLRKPAQLGNVYYIDTGGWQDAGRFTLLDLHTLKSWPR
ncbi:serine/threonine protein phosphatase [Bordetella bronchiseptica]|nr:serine/threonine protein phosphatase [Bordetella bronchiseptica]